MQLELPSPDMQIVLTTCGDAAGLFHQVFIAFLLLKVSLDDQFNRLSSRHSTHLANSIICTYHQNT